LPVIHAFQSAAPFDWLQGPQEGTRFLISPIKPVGLLFRTNGLK
jgi:hypothetical protein